MNLAGDNNHSDSSTPRAKIYPFAYSVNLSTLNKNVAKPFLMGIFSLGLLLPYFQCAMTKLFCSQTRFFGAEFVYFGKPKALIVGYLARIGFLLSSVALVYSTGKVDDVLQFITAAVFIAAVLALLPVSLLASFSYRLNHISWGGNQISLNVSRRVFAARFLHGLSLSFLTLGIAFPYFINEVYRTIWGGLRVGPLKTMYSGELKHLFKLHIGFVLLFIPTLGLNSFWYAAKLIRYFSNASWLGNHQLGAVRGFCDIKGEDLLGLCLLNLLAAVGSLGLAIPWVFNHTYSYLAQRFKFYGDVRFEHVVQETKAAVSSNHGVLLPEAS